MVRFPCPTCSKRTLGRLQTLGSFQLLSLKRSLASFLHVEQPLGPVWLQRPIQLQAPERLLTLFEPLNPRRSLGSFQYLGPRQAETPELLARPSRIVRP